MKFIERLSKLAEQIDSLNISDEVFAKYLLVMFGYAELKIKNELGDNTASNSTVQKELMKVLKKSINIETLTEANQVVSQLKTVNGESYLSVYDSYLCEYIDHTLITLESRKAEVEAIKSAINKRNQPT